MVFLGRSNVGKSSLINRLLGVRDLARTSSEPGRTRSLNFYRVNESFQFVDFPGYGYAAAPRRVRKSWRPLAEGFLTRRKDRVAIAVLLVDARCGPTELDEIMRQWLASAGIRHVVAGTKADKLSGNARASAARRLQEHVGRSSSGIGSILVSARTGLGIAELWTHLDQALIPAVREDRGARWTSGN